MDTHVVYDFDAFIAEDCKNVFFASAGYVYMRCATTHRLISRAMFGPASGAVFRTEHFFGGFVSVAAGLDLFVHRVLVIRRFRF